MPGTVVLRNNYRVLVYNGGRPSFCGSCQNALGSKIYLLRTVQHKLEVVRSTTTLDLIFLCGWFYTVDTTSIPGLRSAFP
jgi:hypothetical protein